MKIKLASSEDKSAWDAYVDSSEAAPYCRFAWKEAVEMAYGHKGYYLLAEERGNITGVLPLFYFRVPFFPARLISLPYCDAGGIFFDNHEIHDQLIQESFILAKNLGVQALEIRSTQENLWPELNIDWHVSVQAEKVRMLLSLPNSSEELWQSFKSKLRSQINKAEKNGLIFSWGNREMLNDFYQVFSQNMHDLGSPVHSKKWIEKIIDCFGENAKMGLVFHDNQPVGCGIILHTKNMVSIPWASTLQGYNRMSPNMMLYWNFLKFAADSNFRKFDFGRSTPNEGTYQFKKQWGASPDPLFWYQASPVVDSPTTHTIKSSKRKFFADLWSKLPLPLANSLGPKARKYISL